MADAKPPSDQSSKSRPQGAPQHGDPCGCDACPLVYSLGTPWTHDGYCPDCGAHCFPAMAVNGKFGGRARLSENDRKERHGRPVAPPLNVPPRGAQVSGAEASHGAAPGYYPPTILGMPAAQALSHLLGVIPDPVARGRAQAVFRGVQIVAPFVAPVLDRAVRLGAKAVRRARKKK